MFEFWMQICLHLLCRRTWEWCFKVLGPSRGSHTVIWEVSLYQISSLILTLSTLVLWQCRHVLPASRSSFLNSLDDVGGSTERTNWGNWFSRGKRKNYYFGKHNITDCENYKAWLLSAFHYRRKITVHCFIKR